MTFLRNKKISVENIKKDMFERTYPFFCFPKREIEFETNLKIVFLFGLKAFVIKKK